MKASAPSWKSSMTLQKKSPTSEAFLDQWAKKLARRTRRIKIHHTFQWPVSFSSKLPENTRGVLKKEFHFASSSLKRSIIHSHFAAWVALRLEKWPLPLEKRGLSLSGQSRAGRQSLMHIQSIGFYCAESHRISDGVFNHRKALLENARISIPLRKFNLG